MYQQKHPANLPGKPCVDAYLASEQMVRAVRVMHVRLPVGRRAGKAAVTAAQALD